MQQPPNQLKQPTVKIGCSFLFPSCGGLSFFMQSEPEIIVLGIQDAGTIWCGIRRVDFWSLRA